jgi:hypothetical protein
VPDRVDIACSAISLHLREHELSGWSRDIQRPIEDESAGYPTPSCHFPEIVGSACETLDGPSFRGHPCERSPGPAATSTRFAHQREARPRNVHCEPLPFSLLFPFEGAVRCLCSPADIAGARHSEGSRSINPESVLRAECHDH